jgi:hypothetical protein
MLPKVLGRIVPLEPLCLRDAGLGPYRCILARSYVKDYRDLEVPSHTVVLEVEGKVFALPQGIESEDLGRVGCSYGLSLR